MNINNISASQVASSVWSQAARTLTADQMQAINAETSAVLSPNSVLNSLTFGAAVQAIASTAHTVRGFIVRTFVNLGFSFQIALCNGGAGSEVRQIIVPLNLSGNKPDETFVVFVDPSLWPKGSRVSVEASCLNAAQAATPVTTAVVCLEAND